MKKVGTITNTRTAPNGELLYRAAISRARQDRRVIRFRLSGRWYYIGPRHYYRHYLALEIHLALEVHKIFSRWRTISHAASEWANFKKEFAQGWRVTHQSGRHTRPVPR